MIEILIVVGILGLCMTLGVPAFVRALHKEGMRKVESDLMEACRDARGEAILKAQPTELTFRPLEGTFSAPGLGSVTLPTDVVIQFLGVNEMELEREETAKVRFYPNGTCDEFVIVVHSFSDGAQCTITLDPVTALADIQSSK